MKFLDINPWRITAEDIVAMQLPTDTQELGGLSDAEMDELLGEMTPIVLALPYVELNGAAQGPNSMKVLGGTESTQQVRVDRGLVHEVDSHSVEPVRGLPRTFTYDPMVAGLISDKLFEPRAHKRNRHVSDATTVDRMRQTIIEKMYGFRNSFRRIKGDFYDAVSLVTETSKVAGASVLGGVRSTNRVGQGLFESWGQRKEDTHDIWGGIQQSLMALKEGWAELSPKQRTLALVVIGSGVLYGCAGGLAPTTNVEPGATQQQAGEVVDVDEGVEVISGDVTPTPDIVVSNGEVGGVYPLDSTGFKYNLGGGFVQTREAIQAFLDAGVPGDEGDLADIEASTIITLWRQYPDHFGNKTYDQVFAEVIGGTGRFLFHYLLNQGEAERGSWTAVLYDTQENAYLVPERNDGYQYPQLMPIGAGLGEYDLKAVKSDAPGVSGVLVADGSLHNVIGYFDAEGNLVEWYSTASKQLAQEERFSVRTVAEVVGVPAETLSIYPVESSTEQVAMVFAIDREQGRQFLVQGTVKWELTYGWNEAQAQLELHAVDEAGTPLFTVMSVDGKGNVLFSRPDTNGAVGQPELLGSLLGSGEMDQMLAEMMGVPPATPETDEAIAQGARLVPKEGGVWEITGNNQIPLFMVMDGSWVDFRETISADTTPYTVVNGRVVELTDTGSFDSSLYLGPLPEEIVLERVEAVKELDSKGKETGQELLLAYDSLDRVMMVKPAEQAEWLVAPFGKALVGGVWKVWEEESTGVWRRLAIVEANQKMARTAELNGIAQIVTKELANEIPQGEMGAYADEVSYGMEVVPGLEHQVYVEVLDAMAGSRFPQFRQFWRELGFAGSSGEELYKFLSTSIGGSENKPFWVPAVSPQGTVIPMINSPGGPWDGILSSWESAEKHGGFYLDSIAFLLISNQDYRNSPWARSIYETTLRSNDAKPHPFVWVHVGDSISTMWGLFILDNALTFMVADPVYANNPEFSDNYHLGDYITGKRDSDTRIVTAKMMIFLNVLKNYFGGQEMDICIAPYMSRCGSVALRVNVNQLNSVWFQYK